PEGRLLLALVPGTRDGDACKDLVQQVHNRTAGRTDLLITSDEPAPSDLSFGLFQDPETPENRGFLVYLGLLGLRGSSGNARKQPESTKLGPRKSESLV
ncbi:MAG TPA: hypothetical protein VKP69_22340, partial [Isosphaeraceae bacterium]|nr:hypothetical protein [Isosphaeraceae bacterium]